MGGFWLFTDLSIKIALENVFDKDNIVVTTYGNTLSASTFLNGIPSEELTDKELFYTDTDYQVIIAIKAVKK